MTATMLPPQPAGAPPAGTPPTPSRAAETLVIVGSVVAPLNLLIAASLTVYDVFIGLALILLLTERRRLPLPPRGYVVAAFVFLITALLSAFRATYPFEALTQVLQYVFIFFVQIPVILAVIRTRKAVILSMALMCLGTLLAILHSHITHQTQGAGRAVVFYSENPNRLGYPAAYLLPILIALWVCADQMWRRRRWLFAVLVAGSFYLAIWALAASASRSSALGAALALIVFVVLRPGVGPGRMLLRAVALAAAVTAAIFLLASTGQLPSTLEDRVERSFSSDTQDNEHLVRDRENLADAGMRAFFDSPYLGTGLDNFRYVAVDYDLNATPQLPHNLWLQFMVQVGIFGTLAIALIFLLWFRDVVGAHKRAGPMDRLLIWSLVSSMVGILAIFMFAPEMLDRHYYLLFGLGLAMVRGLADKETWEGRG
ncbi:MAG TPA: O-antigen ligase family protein [Nocardioidaceae bacterium]|nr:O-antigen ligase family protein [Nocardioidaceae bacterium]